MDVTNKKMNRMQMHCRYTTKEPHGNENDAISAENEKFHNHCSEVWRLTPTALCSAAVCTLQPESLLKAKQQTSHSKPYMTAIYMPTSRLLDRSLALYTHKVFGCLIVYA